MWQSIATLNLLLALTTYLSYKTRNYHRHQRCVVRFSSFKHYIAAKLSVGSTRPTKNPRKEKKNERRKRSSASTRDCSSNFRVRISLLCIFVSLLSLFSTLFFLFYCLFSEFISIFTSGYTDSRELLNSSGSSRRGRATALFSPACNDQLPAN